MLDQLRKKIAHSEGEVRWWSDTRLKKLMDRTIMLSSSMSADRLKAAIDLLEAATGPFKEPSREDLAPLKERYAKFCALIDDQIFVRDLNATLRMHDRFIQCTALGLWDKERISQELQHLEDSLKNAPPIPYGRTELLRSLQGKKLLPPAKGCYFGVLSDEDSSLSFDRLTVGALEEGTGGQVQLEAADMVIQGPDGQLIDLDAANHPVRGLPFSPPLLLWIKARLLEGRLPLVTFRLLDRSLEWLYDSFTANFPTRGTAPKHLLPPEKVIAVQDILDGKLDTYLQRNLQLIASTKAATLVGLFSAFDETAAPYAFGADGRTPYYLLVDRKLDKQRLFEEFEDTRSIEFRRRLQKGVFAGDGGAELRNQYGDAGIPDGPERVRDAWKRFRQLVTASGASSVSLFSCATAYHGNKKALSEHPRAGAQDWNKLEYYWPGEGVLDWLGVGPVREVTESEKGGLSVADALDSFMSEIRNSNWRATPVLIRGLASPFERDPAREAGWIMRTFQELLPKAYPDIKAFFVSFPEYLTLWAADGPASFRRAVSSNAYYKQRLNLQPLPQQ